MNTDLTAEQMLESVKADNSPVSEQDTATLSQPTTSAQQPVQFDPEKLEYDWNGKKIVENWDMVKKRAQMGYDYAQKMAVFKQQQAEFDQTRQDLIAKAEAAKKWEQFDNYAKENPEWARHIEESWNNRTNMQQLSTESQATMNPVLESLQKEIADLRSFKDEFVSEKQKIQQEAEDKAFSSEIEDTAKKFGVDFSQSDEQGATLEWRVLEMMKELGLDGSKKGHFEMAFKHYYFDNLVGKQREQAKEAVVKQSQNLRKMGILDQSRTPPQQAANVFNPSKHSDRDALNFALQELAANRK